MSTTETEMKTDLPLDDRFNRDQNYTISAEELYHLVRLVDYTMHDEAKSYEEAGNPKGHIYESVTALRQAAEGHLGEPILDHSSWPQHIRDSTR